MGADAFVAFYGVRYVIAENEIEAIENRQDSRVVAARQAKLHAQLGRFTNGDPYFLLVGTQLGIFGIENESTRTIDDQTMARIMMDTRSKLVEANLPGEPQIHLQFLSQH